MAAGGKSPPAPELDTIRLHLCVSCPSPRGLLPALTQNSSPILRPSVKLGGRGGEGVGGGSGTQQALTYTYPYTYYTLTHTLIHTHTQKATFFHTHTPTRQIKVSLRRSDFQLVNEYVYVKS